MRFFRYLALAALFFVAAPAFGATLSFTTGTGYAVGDTVPVTVVVSSAQSINGVGATVSYPADKFDLISASKAASVISYWAQEPGSAGAGKVGFQGIIFDPGYTGNNGRVVQILLRAKAAGQATLSFSSAEVLANDGLGTNVLTSASAATVSIAAAAAAPAAPAVTPVQAPAAATASGITITSATHPNQTKWYNSGTVSLDWKNAPGTTAVRVGYDTLLNGTPSVEYGAITHKDLTLKDGTWYFHVQNKTAAGWGSVATYKIQIDTAPPAAMKLVFPHGATTSDPRPIALFNTTDALSGVDHYSVQVNGGKITTVAVENVDSNPYALPEQDPGTGTMKVIAYDAAGNSTEVEGTFEVSGIAAPKLDAVRDVEEGDILQISGMTASNARVDAWVTSGDDGSSQWSRSSANGAFRLIWTKTLPAGTYTVQAQTTDDKGATSRKSDPIMFKVKPVVLLHIGFISLTQTNATILLIFLFALALLGLWWLLERYMHGPRGKHSASVAHRHALVHKQFMALRDAVAKEVESLEKVKDKRDLTAEEARLINKLGKLIEKSEEKLEKALGE